MTDTEDEIQLLLIHSDNGFTCSCQVCGCLLTRGNTYVQIRISGETFSLGYDESLDCCGKELEVVRLFSDPDELRHKVEEIVDYLNDPESKEFFNFLPMPVKLDKCN